MTEAAGVENKMVSEEVYHSCDFCAGYTDSVPQGLGKINSYTFMQIGLWKDDSYKGVAICKKCWPLIVDKLIELSTGDKK